MLPAVRPPKGLLLPLALATALTLGCGGDGGGDGTGPSPSPSLLLTTPALTMAEGGPTATIAVTLDKPPTTANDTLIVSVASLGKLGVAPTTLTFTGNDFSIPQVVTVTALQDADLTADDDTVTFAATGLASRAVPATIADDDVQSIVTDRASLPLAEGDTDTVQVHLDFQPASPVTVVVAATGSVTAQPATLTFTPANYNVAQAVRVTALHDANLVQDVGALTLSATGMAPTLTIPATVDDIDQQSIVLSTTARTLGEGSTFTLQVHLAFQPAANTTVTAASGNPASVAVFGTTTFTFTPANFATAQTVTITAPQDANQGDESVNITFSTPGIPNAILVVTTIDND